MEENVDVKALRARFNTKAASDAGSRDSGSPKSPRPGFGKVVLPVLENNLAHHRLSPTAPLAMAGPGLARFPKPEPVTAASGVPRSVSFHRPPPYPGVRAPVQQAADSKIRNTGEMLQNLMLGHQRPPWPGPGQPPAPAKPSTPVPLRQQAKQRSAGEVVPLRKPLPPEGPMPLKPRRPPVVNLEPYLRASNRRAAALPGPKRSNGFPGPTAKKTPSGGMICPPSLPQRSSKPRELPHQIASVDIVDDDDDQDTYDDIASFEKNESWSDNSSQCVDGDVDDVYEFIDEEQIKVNQVNAKKETKKDAKKKREQEQKEKTARRKKENELKKNFQLQGEVEVIHTASVRHDWNGGGKLDLPVHQGESVEILRVKDNPGGRWLARSLSGNYGYISNTCVDIDYEEVKRKALESRKINTSTLPPPPPDPIQMFNIHSNNSDSTFQDDCDYDDVEPISEDFPLPPPEISIDPKVEKDLKKRFKYEGPLTVLCTMMVDPNGIIKKPGKDSLSVIQGEILDVIQLTNAKKNLCRNRFGRYGYVSTSLLLPMEGDIYDDVDYAGSVYDNDSP